MRALKNSHFIQNFPANQTLEIFLVQKIKYSTSFPSQLEMYHDNKNQEVGPSIEKHLSSAQMGRQITRTPTQKHPSIDLQPDHRN